ncbi:MAG: hypothetical protein WKF89_15800, partial [Chitinophagaceae bacterium]
YLSIIYENDVWNQRVVKMLKGVMEATQRYPTSFGVWADMLQKVVTGVNELVVTGKNSHNLLKEILHIFIPHKILQVSAYSDEKYPLLRGKDFTGKPLVFLCKDYACQAPAADVDSLTMLLGNNHKFS